MDIIIKHRTSDGTTDHEVDLINKKHKVTTLESNHTEEFTVTKKWGSQQKFVEKLIIKEIDKIKERMFVQKKTIADCIKYHSEGNLDVTKRKLEENREMLEFLSSYTYES